MTHNELPEIVQSLIEQHPDVWDAYNKLGQVAAEAGPLDEKAERLVKLAIAVGGGLEGAVRSHMLLPSLGCSRASAVGGAMQAANVSER